MSHTRYPLANVVPEPKDNRDFLLSIPAGLTRELPPSVDLRAHTGLVEDQLQSNSCVANATISALEYMLAKAGRGANQSRLFNYWNARAGYQWQRGVDAGTYLSDGVKSAYTFGSCPEHTWPFEMARVNTEPSTEAFGQALPHRVTRYERVGSNWSSLTAHRSVTALKATLAMGYPVCIAMLVTDDLFHLRGALHGAACTYKRIVNSTAEYTGGHAMLVVGYTDTGFIVENSWGTIWGDEGYGVLSYGSVEQAVFDAIVITEFDGIAFAPEWKDLPTPPMVASLSRTDSIQHMRTIESGNIFANKITATVSGGSPSYDYTWESSDRHVALVGTGATVEPQCTFSSTWPRGETRSVTITCTVRDTSMPSQAASAQTLVRLHQGLADRGPAYRLYRAAFARTPDAGGLAFWEASLAEGMPLSKIADAFISSAEFAGLYGSAVTPGAFITLLYRNVLKRNPDAAGLEFWVSQLRADPATKPAILIGFSESDENKTLTN